MRRVLGFLGFALSLHVGAAFAQAITNVNECTFITDPIALKRCIDGFQLRGPAAQYPQSPPIPPIETPAQAERTKANRNAPSATSIENAPEWLGSKTKSQPQRNSRSRVIDLDRP